MQPSDALHESAVVQAPPVVAVVVVHEPGPWFEDTLESFARQDYPNLRLLFLVTTDRAAIDRDVGEPDADPVFASIESRITARLPEAFVRPADGQPRIRRGRQRGAPAGRRRARPVPRLPRRRRHGPRRATSHGRGALPIERRAWSGRSSSTGSTRECCSRSAWASTGSGRWTDSIELGEVDQEQHDGVRDVFAAAERVHADPRRPVP